MLSLDLNKSVKDCKRKLMSQLAPARLHSGAQYALCGWQHSNAPDTKQRDLLCKSLGWQAGGLFRVARHLLLAKCFVDLFGFSKSLLAIQACWVRSHCWGSSFRHLVQSIECHALSKEGASWFYAAYWICSFATWRRTWAHHHSDMLHVCFTSTAVEHT